ncbi:hypothetical protein L211DRAFT_865267 [Terfezia boudieri ATCC MYA-4762]|uniref:Uncharacterized protein n=1 Tax=Terfezia boudieri ATCC MYA-4762 TaxID=1051890 RepID=A0A3N4LXZ2_9PEZI|nr:hypothetical protein L211DRAFT_865267 [Terfezia boudieri ATCC MYA-4762]
MSEPSIDDPLRLVRQRNMQSIRQVPAKANTSITNAGNPTTTIPTQINFISNTGLCVDTTSSVITHHGPLLVTPGNTPSLREVPTCPSAMRDIEHAQEQSGAMLTNRGRGRGILWPTSQRWVRPDGPYNGMSRGSGRRSKRWPQGRQPQNTEGVGRKVVLRIGQPRPSPPGTAQDALGVGMKREVEIGDDLLLGFGRIAIRTIQEEETLNN